MNFKTAEDEDQTQMSSRKETCLWTGWSWLADHNWLFLTSWSWQPKRLFDSSPWTFTSSSTMRDAKNKPFYFDGALNSNFAIFTCDAFCVSSQPFFCVFLFFFNTNTQNPRLQWWSPHTPPPTSPTSADTLCASQGLKVKDGSWKGDRFPLWHRSARQGQPKTYPQSSLFDCLRSSSTTQHILIFDLWDTPPPSTSTSYFWSSILLECAFTMA